MTNTSPPSSSQGRVFYPYSPSHVLPIIFAVLVGLSFLVHLYQSYRYRYWRVTWFLLYAGLVFTTGWIMRAVSSHNTSNLGVYIAQTILIYAGPPIYAATEYNILGRLMYYLPMHAPLNPRIVVYFFIYLGAAVEGLTGAGAGYLSSSKRGTATYINGGRLIAIATVLQGAVECVFILLVAILHHRCARAGMLARNVKIVCFTLYGTSLLILLRCIFRAVEAFTIYSEACLARGNCGSAATHEWYLYVFEAGPMVLFSVWLNVLHPGRFLPADNKRYLGLDGKTERMGPGWIDERATWKVFADPFNSMKDTRAEGEQTKFWLRPEESTVCEGGSFALGSASNHAGRKDFKKHESESRV